MPFCRGKLAGCCQLLGLLTEKFIVDDYGGAAMDNCRTGAGPALYTSTTDKRLIVPDEERSTNGSTISGKRKTSNRTATSGHCLIPEPLHTDGFL